MTKSKVCLLIAGSAAVAAAATVYSAPNGPMYDQSVIPEVIFGSGNGNAFFTTQTSNGVEVGLRAKQRFPSPVEGGFSNGDGTYSVPIGDACPGYNQGPFSSILCLATPRWSFDWHINTDVTGATGAVLDDFIYELGMDADPSKKTDFTVFDLITPSLVAPAYDHSLGNNGTANGGGIEDLVNYVANIGLYNVAQNSWNYEFFNNVGTSLASFDPSVDGNYIIYLKVIDPSKAGKGSKGSRGKSDVVAYVEIQILVGNAKAI